MCGASTRVGAPQPLDRQVGEQAAEFVGGRGGESRLEPPVVLVEVEVALRQGEAQAVCGLAAFVVAGADGYCGGHDASRVDLAIDKF